MAEYRLRLDFDKQRAEWLRGDDNRVIRSAKFHSNATLPPFALPDDDGEYRQLRRSLQSIIEQQTGLSFE